MPKLRRLSGKAVIAILEQFGFVVIRITGSHHHMRRTVGDENQYLMVAVHGNKPIPTGTLHKLYRRACHYIPEDELRPYFYS